MLRNLAKSVHLKCTPFFKVFFRNFLSPSPDDLIITDKCIERLKIITADGQCLRILVDGGGCSGFEYKMSLDENINDDDFVFEKNGIKILVDKVIFCFFPFYQLSLGC